MIYKCSCCGLEYDSMPLCFGGDYPLYYFEIPEEERGSRIVLETSTCIIDDEYFFHKGRITIPIIEFAENLVF